MHMDCPENHDVVHFITSLENAGFPQYIHGPTHKDGHTLDLFVLRLEDNLISSCVVDSRLSDHNVICYKICQPNPFIKEKRVVVSRRLQTMNVESFQEDFQCYWLSSENNANELAVRYNISPPAWISMRRKSVSSRVQENINRGIIIPSMKPADCAEDRNASGESLDLKLITSSMYYNMNM